MEGGPAWRRATDAARAAGVTLFPVIDLDGAARVVELVERTWGPGTMSRELVRAFQHAGSVVVGAEAGGACVGFVLGFLGWEGGVHLHSHMLAVLPDRQSRGVGFALKLAQRAAALDHDVDEVRWTYDPLVARNGRFNLVKLGAVATGFFPRFYGEMHDLLNRGDRSDRFEVRWSLRSERVDRALAGEPERPAEGPVLLEAVPGPSGPVPRPTGARPDAGARVAVPPDHAALRASDPDLGRRWREAGAEAFRRCFEASLLVTWMSRDGVYVFEPEARP